MKGGSKSGTVLWQRLKAAAKLGRTRAEFARMIETRRRRIGLRGTPHTFTRTEIARLGRTVEARSKIAQSDVPDNMLALLSALRASTGPIPS